MKRKSKEVEQASAGTVCTSNDLGCAIGKPEASNSKKLTIFTAKWCGACKSRIPQILKKAQALGLKVKLVDIDNPDSEDKKMLKRVGFVPYIDYMGQEIDEDELDLMYKNREPKEAE